MELDDLKSGWQNAGGDLKSETDLQRMTRIANHPSIKKIRTKLIIESIVLLLILFIYYDWFDGNKKQLSKAMDLGCFVSYGPVMVYSKDKQVLLSNTNKDKILVETDGPVRFSHCFGMKSAQISFIPSVIFSLSRTLQQDYDDSILMLEKNSKQYLGV